MGTLCLETTCQWRARAFDPATPGFSGNYRDFSFVRDGAGNRYWAARSTPAVGGTAEIIIRRGAPDSTLSDLCQSHDFRDVRWMTCSAGGTVYLIAAGDLCAITPAGTVSTIARDLAQFHVNDRHGLMGLWLDHDASVYCGGLFPSCDEKSPSRGRGCNRGALVLAVVADWWINRAERRSLAVGEFLLQCRTRASNSAAGHGENLLEFATELPELFT